MTTEQEEDAKTRHDQLPSVMAAKAAMKGWQSGVFRTEDGKLNHNFGTAVLIKLANALASLLNSEEVQAVPADFNNGELVGGFRFNVGTDNFEIGATGYEVGVSYESVIGEQIWVPRVLD